MPTSTSFRTLGLVILVFLAVLGLGFGAANAQAPDPAQLELGARLYSENCALCHGENGEGRIGATLAKDWPSIRPELTTQDIIAGGVPGSPMPAWSQANGGPLTDEEIDALVVYILSWQTGGVPNMTPPPTATARPPITPVPEVQGDPNSGAIVYDQNCAVCHGAEGQGRIGATLAKDWPAIRPDLTVKNTITNGIANTAMPAWSQTQGGPLSEQEINDTVAFILSLPNITQSQPTATSQPEPTQASGWVGILVFVLLVAIVFGVIWLVQRKK
jgi:mono/diheme cytochrome c family protein